MNYQEIFDQRGELYAAAHVLCPEAREEESAALLKWLKPQQRETIVVAAAGSGFDAVSIAKTLSGNARIICVEPCRSFCDLIPDGFEVLNVPLDSIPLSDGTADAVINLAALHHVSDRDAAFREWTRILKPDGRIVIADVEAGSSNGLFLNTVVNEFTPGGHEGWFLEPGQLTFAFESLGCHSAKESLETYEWRFDSCEQMIDFSRHIFGMTKATSAQIDRGIRTFIPPVIGNSVTYPWSLRFFEAHKAAA